MDAKPGVAGDSMPEAIPPASSQIPHRPGSGLLSSWHGTNSRSLHRAGLEGIVALAEQETFKQKAVDRQVMGSEVRSNGTNLQELANGNSHTAPHDSGISSSPPIPMQAGSDPTLSWRSRQPESAWPWGSQPPQSQQRSSSLQTLAHPLQPVAQTQARPFSSPLSMPEMAMPISPVPAASYGGGPVGGQPQGKNRRFKKRRFPIWARVIVAVVLMILVLVGSIAGYLYSMFSAPVGNIVNQQVQRAKGEDDPNASRNGTDILSGPRINILLLGSDTDQKFTNADGSHTYLAQSDIVVTIDPATKSVGMLSIPRDFYIPVPGHGMYKLDEAYSLGGVAVGNGAYSPGGVALSRLTIEQAFGIPINYYAWVGLDGFVKVIDTVGGVDVDVAHPITDDNYPDDVGNHTNDIYAYKRLYIPPGPQHLDGLPALEYVRSRHADLVGDFGRSARQQQVLSALKTKLNNPDIVGKLPAIANDLNGFVKTDMQLTDAFKLMNFARSLDPNKINRVILGPPYSSSANLPGGESIVNPNCAKIVPVIAKMFGLGSKAACNIQANSGSSTSVASNSPTSSPLVSAVAGNSWQAADQMASTSLMSLTGGNGGNDLFGTRSLLDLLLLTVFESPQAIQV
jgi:LCP family protein required for cell wall assembly